AVLAAALALNTLGNVVWAVAEIGGQPAPDLAAYCYYSFYVVFALGALCLPAAPASRTERLKLLIDVCILMLGAGLVIWSFWLEPESASAGNSLGRFSVARSFPFAGLGLFLALTLLILRRVEGNERA